MWSTEAVGDVTEHPSIFCAVYLAFHFESSAAPGLIILVEVTDVVHY